MTKSSDLPVPYRLDPERFPALNDVLAGDSAASLELRRLLDELKPRRAPRKPVKVIGKLVRGHAGQELEETVIVREISETGVVVLLPGHADVGLLDICRPVFRFRVEDGEKRNEVELRATLVRMISADERNGLFAFRFDSVSPDVAPLLYDLSHHVGKTVEGRSLRPSTGPLSD